MSRASSENGRVRWLLFLLLVAMLCSFPIGTAPTNIAGLSLIGFWVLTGQAWRDRAVLLHQSWSLPVLLIILLQVGSLVWSQNLLFGAKLAVRSYYWLIGFAALSALLHVRNLHTLAWSFLAGLSINVSLSLLQFSGILRWQHSTHKYGLMGYINYSLFVAIGILTLSYLFKETVNHRIRLALLVAMGACFLNLAILPGRSGYVAFLAALPFILVNLFGRRKQVALLVCFVGAVVALVSSPTVRQRLAQIPADIRLYASATTAEEKMTSVGLRLYMWQGAARIFLNHPVAGVGKGGYITAMEKQRKPNDPDIPFSQPHNSYLYIAASYGLIGIVLYGWLFYVLLRDSWRARDKVEGWLPFSFLLVILVGSLTDTQLLSPSTGILLGLVAGLLPVRQVTA